MISQIRGAGTLSLKYDKQPNQVSSKEKQVASLENRKEMILQQKKRP